MGLRVDTHIASIDVHRSLQSVTGRHAGSSRRLSSSLRIHCAADDVAGPATCERLRAQVRALDRQRRDDMEAIPLRQTAGGVLDEVRSILARLRELTVRSGDQGRRAAGKAGALESRIRDVQVACQTAARTRDSMLQQAAIAVRSQANPLPQSALRLLG
jgi:flagellin-like hook-associated protein FlgL